MLNMAFAPENKVQELAYKKWKVENAKEFADKVDLAYGTARTIWQYASTNHKADHLKAVADALDTTIDKLFYEGK
jgi:hypothetical protein